MKIVFIIAHRELVYVFVGQVESRCDVRAQMPDFTRDLRLTTNFFCSYEEL